MKLWNASIYALCGSLMFALTLAGCEGTTAPKREAPKVNYISAQPQSVTLTTELPGRTAAFMLSEVRPQVNGIIQQRLFEEGADVAAGQVLYQIDPAVYQAAFNNAQATLAKAEANAAAARLLAQRYGTIVKLNAVSKQENDNAVAASGQAIADVAAAQAALESARINLEYTKVKAPVGGRIGRSTVTPGALVTQNQQMPLATVQQLDPMYVDVTQSSSDLLKLKRALAEGQIKGGVDAAKVKLKLEDGSFYARKNPLEDGSPDWIEGELLFSDVTVEQSTGVVTVRAKFPNTKGILLPGMYVRAVLEEGVRDNTILLPQQYASRDSRGRLIVNVLVQTNPSKNATIQQALDSGMYRIEPRPITVDRSVGNNWLVTGGIMPGDKVQIDGYQMTRPGMLVHATDMTSSSGLAPTAPLPASVTK